jgi:putative phosphoribosyl transferase
MKADLPYGNRTEAGRLLARELAHYKSKPDVVVLGSRAVAFPAAAEVAGALQAPLDVVVVRKLGVPVQPELAMGAIAGDGTQVLDKDLVYMLGITEKHVHAVIIKERAELERRERLYRGCRGASNWTVERVNPCPQARVLNWSSAGLLQNPPPAAGALFPARSACLT